MENELDCVTIIVAICVAAYVAIMLDYVASSELGWSLARVRGSAVIGILAMTAMMLVALLRDRRGKLQDPG